MRRGNGLTKRERGIATFEVGLAGGAVVTAIAFYALPFGVLGMVSLWGVAAAVVGASFWFGGA